MGEALSLARPLNPDNPAPMLLRRPDDQFSNLIAGHSDRAAFVERLIEAADFDEHDRDIGTSGLCGTFAIALYTVLLARGITAVPKLAYVGELPRDRKRLHWRHAVLDVDSKLFDVDGRVEPEHVLENYCWGTTSNSVGFCALKFGEFSELIKATRNAFDAGWNSYWIERLHRAAS